MKNWLLARPHSYQRNAAQCTLYCIGGTEHTSVKE